MSCFGRKENMNIGIGSKRTARKKISMLTKMTLKEKNLLIEEYPLSAKYISYDNEWWWFKGNVKDVTGVGRFVIGLADQIEIIDSLNLKIYLHKFIKTYSMSYYIMINFKQPQLAKDLMQNEKYLISL